MPCQAPTSKPAGISPASAMAGTSGSSGVRSALLTAIARTRLSWISGSAVTTVSLVNCTLPAAVSVSAAAVPR